MNAMSMGRFRRITVSIPDDATLHGYLHTWGLTVQAEWVEDDQIMNPGVLRIPFEVRAAGPAVEPEWAAYSAAPSAVEGRVLSRQLRPGTRLRWTGTPGRGWSEFAVLERRKTPFDQPHQGVPFLPGWWCEGGGGLADAVIDDPNGKWVVEAHSGLGG